MSDDLTQRAELLLERMVDLEGAEHSTTLHDLLNVQDAISELLARLQQVEQANTELLATNDRLRLSWREDVAAEKARCAAAAQEIAGLRALIQWALGESGEDEFPPLPDDWPKRKFYWREELRARLSALAGTLKGAR